MSKIFVILSVLALSLVTTACGGSSSDAVTNCKASCTATSAAACETELMESSMCETVCDGYDSADQSCQDAAAAYYACHSTQTMECGIMGAQPADAEACGSLATDFTNACQSEG